MTLHDSFDSEMPPPLFMPPFDPPGSESPLLRGGSDSPEGPSTDQETSISVQVSTGGPRIGRGRSNPKNPSSSKPRHPSTIGPACRPTIGTTCRPATAL